MKIYMYIISMQNEIMTKQKLMAT